MPAMQIPTKSPPPDNQSRPKLGPLTHLTRTRALPRRHLQGGARHETCRCRPVLAGFWAFIREGERGWRGEDLGGTSREEERRQRHRCRRAGQTNQTVSRGPTPHHRAHIISRSGARDASNRGRRCRGSQGGGSQTSDPARRGTTPRRSQPPPAAHHPRGRAIRPEAPAAGASREDAAASPNRAAAPDPKTSAMDEAPEASPPPSPASAGDFRARPSGGGEGERGKGVAAWGEP